MMTRTTRATVKKKKGPETALRTTKQASTRIFDNCTQSPPDDHKFDASNPDHVNSFIENFKVEAEQHRQKGWMSYKDNVNTLLEKFNLKVSLMTTASRKMTIGDFNKQFGCDLHVICMKQANRFDIPLGNGDVAMMPADNDSGNKKRLRSVGFKTPAQTAGGPTRTMTATTGRKVRREDTIVYSQNNSPIELSHDAPGTSVKRVKKTRGAAAMDDYQVSLALGQQVVSLDDTTAVEEVARDPTMNAEALAQLRQMKAKVEDAEKMFAMRAQAAEAFLQS